MAWLKLNRDDRDSRENRARHEKAASKRLSQIILSGNGVEDEDPDPTIRLVVDADEEQIASLLVAVFTSWSRRDAPIAHLRWKMRNHPLAPAHQFVAEVDSQIVGTNLCIVRKIRIQGRDRLAMDGVDLAVHPSYRGQGIYRAMVAFGVPDPDRQLDLSVSYSANPAVNHVRSQLGSQPLANRIQVLIRRYGIRRSVAAPRGGRLPAPLSALRIWALTILGRLIHPPYRRPQKVGWSISTVDEFDESIDDFFDTAAQPFDFIVVRTKGYLNWRYCDTRGGRFTVRIAEQDGRILGYLVIKLDDNRGYIVDLLALPHRYDVVRSLIEDGLRTFEEAGVTTVTCWMISRHPYNHVMRKYGFINSRRRTGFQYRPRNLDPAELTFLRDVRARIHIMLGDSDAPSA